MALDKLVDSAQLDTDLTSVANAIRTKGGTSAQLAFPGGFVSAVDAIPTGGGNKSSGTITLAADGDITIPHNLNSLRVICLVRPTGTIKPSTGYKHMSLVAVNFLEIYSTELQSVIYDFTGYNSANFPDPISRTGPYPGSVALKAPWTNRTEAQWQGYSNWEGNFGFNNGAGELKVTFNLNTIEAKNFAKGSYEWEAFTV